MKHSSRFYLRTPEVDQSAIYARISFGGTHAKVYLGITIETKFWSSEKQKVLSTSQGKRYAIASDVNGCLEQFTAEVSKMFSTAALQKQTLIPELVKQKLSNFFSPKRADTKNELVSAYEEFTSRRSKLVSPGRARTYLTVLNHLKEFEATRRKKIKPQDLSVELYEQFLEYLFDKKFTPSNVRKIAKVVRLFSKDIVSRGIADTEYAKFSLPKDTMPDIIALTEEELASVINLDLTHSDHLRRTRDLFVIQCYTGLRFSDAIRLTRDHIDFIETDIKIIAQKTRQQLLIPTNPELRRLLASYDYNPPKMTNQEANRHLKTIASLAGIDKPIHRLIYKGRQPVEMKVPKWQLITTHTGRKTFCTLSLQKGMKAEVVMSITGQKDYRIFRRYVEMTSRTVRDGYHEAWG